MLFAEPQFHGASEPIGIKIRLNDSRKRFDGHVDQLAPKTLLARQRRDLWPAVFLPGQMKLDAIPLPVDKDLPVRT
jgi:hypothetical protein